MEARYKDLRVYVLRVFINKQQCIISYNEDKSKAFSVDLKELTDMNTALQAEVNRVSQ